MGSLGAPARVGVVVILALIFIGVMLWLFQVIGSKSKTIELVVNFQDATGLEPTVDVAMAGVPIGRVGKIKLVDEHAEVHLEIQYDKLIPRGSQFVITTSALAATGTLEVIPPTGVSARTTGYYQDGDRGLVGGKAGDLNSAMAKADGLLDQVSHTIKQADGLLESTQRLIGDPLLRRSMERTAANLDTASANGVRLTGQMSDMLTGDNTKVLALLQQVQLGTRAALDNITATTSDIRMSTSTNRKQIDEIISNLRDTTSSVSGITAQMNDVLKNGDVTKNLSATVANLRTTTEKLSTIADNFAKLSGDSGMQGDLKETVHNLKLTTEQTAMLLERVNHLAGTRPKTTTTNTTTNPATNPATNQTDPPAKLPFSVDTRIDLNQNLRLKHFRADVNGILQLGQGTQFGYGGIYGLGDTNNLNLEYGRRLAPTSSLDYRLGLYASKLAVGADYGLNKSTTLSVDLYDPNHHKLDARSVFMLNNDMGLSIGVQNITNAAGLTVGMEMRH